MHLVSPFLHLANSAKLFIVIVQFTGLNDRLTYV